MRAIGIDIGTTTISAVVLDRETKGVVTARTISNGSFISTKHEWEKIQDVPRILEKAKAVLDELLEEYPDVTSIGLTGQMHGILYLDQEGNCISPLYIWQDGRGNLPMNGQETYVQYAVRITECSVASGYGLVTHFYNLRNNLVPAGAVRICTIGDYLGMVLTGRKEPLVHSSNAASMGFFDVRAGVFCEEKLHRLGIKAEILPKVTEDFESLGTYRGITVTAAIGDNQASFLGSAGMEVSAVLVNMGTGGQISVLSDVYFEAPGIEARPFVKGKYLLVGASLCGGRAYAILEKFFHSYAKLVDENAGEQYNVMAKLAEKGAKLADGMTVRTTFHGTRVNPTQRGEILGISEDNFTPEGLVYGVLKGMAQELSDMFELIRAGTGMEAKRLIASGNGLRKNAVLQRIFAEMFQTELQMARYQEEAACGAAVGSSERLLYKGDDSCD